MASVITAWDRPRQFVEQQRSGPLASWRHEPTFTALGADQTLMRDTAEFRSPLGAVGGVVDRLMLLRYLTPLLPPRNAC